MENIIRMKLEYLEMPVNMAEVFEMATVFFGKKMESNVTVGKYINCNDEVALYAKCGDKVVDIPVEDVNAVYCK